jgi:hypothetical protein
MNLPTTMRPVRLMALLLSATLLFSCKKDDDAPSGNGFPKEVTIEYKASSTTSGLNNANVTYTNESGGLSTVENAALPFSKKFKRTVNKYEGIGLTGTTSVGGNLKLEILIDNKVEKSQTFTGTSFVHGIFSYTF